MPASLRTVRPSGEAQKAKSYLRRLALHLGGDLEQRGEADARGCRACLAFQRAFRLFAASLRDRGSMAMPVLGAERGPAIRVA